MVYAVQENELPWLEHSQQISYMQQLTNIHVIVYHVYLRKVRKITSFKTCLTV